MPRLFISTFLSNYDKNILINRNACAIIMTDKGGYKMEKAVSKTFKKLIVFVSAACVFLYGVVIPYLGKEIIQSMGGEFKNYYGPWLALIWLTALPLAIAFIDAWKITSNIEKGRSFSVCTAKMLKNISVLAALDSGIFMAGNILYMILNISHPSVFLASTAVCAFGVCLSVFMGSVSKLAEKAADIKSENDLTV